MARTVKEWIGKNDDASIPASVKRRIREKQGNKCALTGDPFGPKNKPEYDHITALWLGGQHRESNLQAIGSGPHKAKTKAEATVRAKLNRIQDKHFDKVQSKRPMQSMGFNKPTKQPKQLSKQLPAWKRRIIEQRPAQPQERTV